MEFQVVPSHSGAGFGVHASQPVGVDRVLGVVRRGEEPGRVGAGDVAFEEVVEQGYELRGDALAPDASAGFGYANLAIAVLGASVAADAQRPGVRVDVPALQGAHPSPM